MSNTDPRPESSDTPTGSDVEQIRQEVLRLVRSGTVRWSDVSSVWRRVADERREKRE